ncbi:hypothetical protein WN48_05075 [Eufriesea mexicana]|nr:hypothetical protein WN48_05075 [Eufriesea mexicana]
MKWLGASSAGAAGEPAPSMQLHHPSANGHIPTDAEQCGQVMAGGDSMRIQPGQTHQIGVNRTQDDAMVGYVFQRPTEAEFNAQSSTFQTKQAPRAWALADDAIIDNNPEKWKYPITKLSVPQQNQPQQLGLQTMNNVHLPYEIHPMQLKSGAPGAEHLVYLNNQMTAQQQVALFHHQQHQQQQQFRNGQVTRRAEGTLETVESFGIGYGQGAGTSTSDWMKPPGDLFLYCDMKDLGADMVFIFVQRTHTHEASVKETERGERGGRGRDEERERTTGFASLVPLILREDSGRDPRPRGLGRGRWPRGSLATTSTLPFHWWGNLVGVRGGRILRSPFHSAAPIRIPFVCVKENPAVVAIIPRIRRDREERWESPTYQAGSSTSSWYINLYVQDDAKLMHPYVPRWSDGGFREWYEESSTVCCVTVLQQRSLRTPGIFVSPDGFSPLCRPVPREKRGRSKQRNAFERHRCIRIENVARLSEGTLTAPLCGQQHNGDSDDAAVAEGQRQP